MDNRTGQWYINYMGRKFDIPIFYRSTIISRLKALRREADLRKKDFSPSTLDLGRVKFKIARHFGFCFGVENAIEIAFRAIQENPDKRVFLLSEAIHNPHVNNDLLSRGVRFILAPDGKQLIPFDELRPDDIVIVPAFGTTVELFEKLSALGINPRLYDATCPFVEKVWKRAEQLGLKGYTVVIHGKHSHEETRATFSHARLTGPSIVIRDMQEAKLLARYIRRELTVEQFRSDFEGRYSKDFDPVKDLEHIGVVNQTTMLAEETQAISEFLKDTIREFYAGGESASHFADTRDTLCYATSENQTATHGLVAAGGDLAIVVGGYNSSNTSHLVELCEHHLPTYYIKDADEIVNRQLIRHLDMKNNVQVTTENWLPEKDGPIEILLTAGASSPDVLVDQVLNKIASFFEDCSTLEQAFDGFEAVISDVATAV